MKTIIPFIISLLLLSVSYTLDAQKTYKAVCDKSDGRVKIVDGDDRSPSLVPLKGDFPFYQVAEKWVKENYPNGGCDPAAAAAQNRAAANAAAQPSNLPAQPPANQTKPPAPASSYGAPAGQPLAPVRAPRYRNTSMFISFLFSDFGKVYGIEPPLFPGVSIGIDQVIGTKFYGGTMRGTNPTATACPDTPGGLITSDARRPESCSHPRPTAQAILMHSVYGTRLTRRFTVTVSRGMSGTAPELPVSRREEGLPLI